MWGLNLGVHACQKKLSHFDIGIHMLLFNQYIKGIFFIYINITVGFKKSGSDEKSSIVMLVITVGLF